MDHINSIIKEPGKKARGHMIENSLEAFQAAVGGYIQTIPVMIDTVMIVNEEGKIRDLPHNFYIDNPLPGEIFFSSTPNADTIDEIVGTMLIVGVSEDGTEFTDLDLGVQDQLLEELWAL